MPPKKQSDEATHAKRELLLAHYDILVRERGITAVQVSHLAKAASIADGTVYLYFPHIEALRQAWLSRFATPDEVRVLRHHLKDARKPKKTVRTALSAAPAKAEKESQS